MPPFERWTLAKINLSLLGWRKRTAGRKRRRRKNWGQILFLQMPAARGPGFLKN
jgi:hypothetical protein